MLFRSNETIFDYKEIRRVRIKMSFDSITIMMRLRVDENATVRGNVTGMTINCDGENWIMEIDEKNGAYII